jgi:hypothetical protein
MLLFKCMLLQKWFRINSEILRQFEKQGLTINEGVAIDARLVKFNNHPISNKQIKEFKEKMSTPEGKLDKNGKPPLPSLLLLLMIPTCFNTAPLSVVIPNSPLKKYMQIKGTPD